MSTKKTLLRVTVLGLAIALAWAFLGLYFDREFSEPYVFLKHRPSATLVFSAPAGESDLTSAEMSPADRRDESAFREYVERAGGRDRSLHLQAVLVLAAPLLFVALWPAAGLLRRSRAVHA